MNPDLPSNDEHRHPEFVIDRPQRKRPAEAGEVICETVDRVRRHASRGPAPAHSAAQSVC